MERRYLKAIAEIKLTAKAGKAIVFMYAIFQLVGGYVSALGLKNFEEPGKPYMFIYLRSIHIPNLVFVSISVWYVRGLNIKLARMNRKSVRQKGAASDQSSAPAFAQSVDPSSVAPSS